MIRALVACEFSQEVTFALRCKGVEAYSCDLEPCIGGFPEWHIQDDVLKHLDVVWDLVIAHPPCTYLSKAGAQLLLKNGEVINHERYLQGLAARSFFLQFLDLDHVPFVCVENPIPLKIYGLPRYSQVIQPYWFGDPRMKTTCLWLKGLPNLVPTDLVDPTSKIVCSTDHRKCKVLDTWSRSGARSAKKRSITSFAIAQAMADQWVPFIDQWKGGR